MGFGSPSWLNRLLNRDDRKDEYETEPLVAESGASGSHRGSDNADRIGVSAPESNSCLPAAGGVGSAKLTAFAVGTAAALTYIALSASMILCNKFLMRSDVFPFPVMLTSMHMVCSLSLAVSLQRLFPSLFPAYSRVFAKRCSELDIASNESQVDISSRTLSSLLPFAPIAVCGAICLVTGNSAYRYASVSFLQMVKESHIMFVYILMLVAGLEQLKLRMAAVIIFVAISAMVAVYGEVYFSWQGLILQLVSGLSGSGQIVLNNLLMTRSSMGKIDPLTLVLCTAPVMLIALIPANVFFWDARIPMLLRQWLPILACNAVLAFALQISAATLIWVTSGTGYALACVAKDLAIVAAAQLLFHESFTTIQVLGFAGSISGMVIYSGMKLFPEVFEPAT